jgi:sec-independent protein translocase protein TatB
MFDLGWGELLVVGVVALVVLGPKELPNALRTISKLTKTARKLAGEFQSGVNEIVREADLEDARKVAQGISKGSISKAIEKAVDPTGEMKTTITGIETEAKAVTPPPAATAAPTSKFAFPSTPKIAAPIAAADATATPAATAPVTPPPAATPPVAAPAEAAIPALEAEAKS